MASMGSFTLESSVLVHSGNHGRPRSPFLGGFRTKNFLSSSLNDSTFGGAKIYAPIASLRCSRLTDGCRVRRVRRIRRVRATDKDSEAVEDGDEPEDALEATIEKSKKVLAIQRELLQQIAERRKLVSSIKSSTIDPGSSKTSNVETNNSFPSLDTSDSNKDYQGDSTGSFLSSNNGHLTVEDALETVPPTITKSSSEDVKGPEKDLSHEKTFSTLGAQSQLIDKTSKDFSEDAKKTAKDLSNKKKLPDLDSPSQLRAATIKNFSEVAKKHDKVMSHEKMFSDLDSQSQLRYTTPEIAWSDELPSFLSSSSATSTAEDKMGEILKESSIKEEDLEADMPASEDEKPPPLAGANVMNVMLVAAECAPWSKTGGLGDVAGALPKALARRGHRVMVVVPRYGNYSEPQDTGVRRRYKVDGQDIEVIYYQAYIDGVDFVFIDSPVFRHLDKNIYGGNREDILKRMVLFCRAAVEVPWYVPCGGVCYGDGNLVFIANDWHTALLPVYLKAYYRDHGIMKYTRSVLVIHNIAHQGRGPVENFSYVDLPPHYLDHFRLYDPIGGEHFNIFAAGLKMADRVVTVSHGYAWELKTSEGGWGLHNIINENDWKLQGIVNGIDTKEWNPQFDVHLQSDGYTNYSLETLKMGKAQCKAALQKELRLPVRDNVPLIGFIGRLDFQKGVDLIQEAIPWMMGQDVQLVMLGTGRHDLEEMLKKSESEHKDKVRGWVGFSVETAHRITAGADILLMPSRFEPCGLNQLYAMKYGTVPVVHAVGGLRDTVQQFDPFNEAGLGWTFDRADKDRLIHALGNCLLTYRDYKHSWEGLQRRGMMQDLSWDHAAEKYEEVLVAAKYQW